MSAMPAPTVSQRMDLLSALEAVGETSKTSYRDGIERNSLKREEYVQMTMRWNAREGKQEAMRPWANYVP
jgi:hypothetical protein